MKKKLKRQKSQQKQEFDVSFNFLEFWLIS